MSPLEHIMSLTSAIEECVASADWAGATDLDGQRRELLQALFANHPGAAGDGSTRAILEQLRARTDATLAAVNTTRQELAATVRRLQAAPDVVRAYASNGSRDRLGDHLQ